MVSHATCPENARSRAFASLGAIGDNTQGGFGRAAGRQSRNSVWTSFSRSFSLKENREIRTQGISFFGFFVLFGFVLFSK